MFKYELLLWEVPITVFALNYRDQTFIYDFKQRRFGGLAVDLFFFYSYKECSHLNSRIGAGEGGRDEKLANKIRILEPFSPVTQHSKKKGF